MKEIRLTQGKVALVDDEDFEHLNQWKWQYHSYGYASRSVHIDNKRSTILMHRIVTGDIKGMDVDHKDHNPLNNQKYNLRVCTSGQNLRNTTKKSIVTSKFKGVSVARSNKNRYYVARIKINNKRPYKFFPMTTEGEISAALWYNSMAIEHFGEFAHLNTV